MRHRPVIWLAVAALVAFGATSFPAAALSPSDIRGPCKAEYQKWNKRGGYGAFAYGSKRY